MGKVRAKSSSTKAKSNEIKMAPSTMDRNKPSTSTAGLNLTSGRIKKPSKKSVTFRSNLTDVVSAEDVLRGGRIVSGGLVDPASAISENSVNSSSGPINLSRLGKTLKEVVKDKKQRMKVRREAFMKKIESVKVAEKEAKEAAKRKATPIVGDTKPLMDALPAPAAPVATNSGLNPLMDLAGFVESHNLEEFKSIPKKKFNTKQRQKEIAEGLEYFASALNCQPPTL